MNYEKFVEHHLKRLNLNEVQNGLLVAILQSAEKPHFWHFGRSGQCAVQIPGRAIVLGMLPEPQCRELAEQTVALDYPGVIGTGLTTHWFADRAAELGVHFHDVEPQQIYALREPPKHPHVKGHWRHIRPEESDVFIQWSIEFAREGLPLDPLPSPVELAETAASGRYIFWTIEDVPVSMAGIVRKLRTTAAITGVYTPPELRGHGYAGAVTAVLAEQIIESGLVTTLYTDIRNPASNRCYSRLGFEPAYPSFHYHR